MPMATRALGLSILSMMNDFVCLEDAAHEGVALHVSLALQGSRASHAQTLIELSRASHAQTVIELSRAMQLQLESMNLT